LPQGPLVHLFRTSLFDFDLETDEPFHRDKYNKISHSKVNNRGPYKNMASSPGNNGRHPEIHMPSETALHLIVGLAEWASEPILPHKPSRDAMEGVQ
jgi:hypothetical protein